MLLSFSKSFNVPSIIRISCNGFNGTNGYNETNDINVLKDVLNTKPYHSFSIEVDEKIKLLEKKIENGECDERRSSVAEER